MPGLASSHRAAHDMGRDKQIIIMVMRKVKIGYQDIDIGCGVKPNQNIRKIVKKCCKIQSTMKDENGTFTIHCLLFHEVLPDVSPNIFWI